LLEIGVLNGKSIRVWEAYFPNAEIVGADIVQASKRFEKDRTKIEIIDQSNLEDLVYLGSKHGPFDVIIEDGSHMWEHQITSLRTLFPFVKDGGYYIAEDLQTNFGERYSHYKGVATISFVDYVKKLVDFRVGDEEVDIESQEDAFLRTYGRNIDLISFAKRACLIKKRMKPRIQMAVENKPISTIDSNGTLQASIYAHVRNIGDIYSPNGYINLGLQYPIQGFEINSTNNCLEYRAKTVGGQWTDWMPEGEFLGSRSEMITFAEVSVRIRSDFQNKLKVEVQYVFNENGNIRHVIGNNLPENSTHGDLCGIQISIVNV
jgi:hypothetical protein